MAKCRESIDGGKMTVARWIDKYHPSITKNSIMERAIRLLLREKVELLNGYFRIFPKEDMEEIYSLYLQIKSEPNHKNIFEEIIDRWCCINGNIPEIETKKRTRDEKNMSSTIPRDGEIPVSFNVLKDRIKGPRYFGAQMRIVERDDNIIREYEGTYLSHLENTVILMFQDGYKRAFSKKCKMFIKAS